MFNGGFSSPPVATAAAGFEGRQSEMLCMSNPPLDHRAPEDGDRYEAPGSLEGVELNDC